LNSDRAALPQGFRLRVKLTVRGRTGAGDSVDFYRELKLFKEYLMTTITFATLELVEKLKTAGLAQEQAEAVIRAISAAQQDLVTKADLEQALAPIRTDLTVLKWMMGVILAGVVSLVIKGFF
jgi:hypothetical protein